MKKTILLIVLTALIACISNTGAISVSMSNGDESVSSDISTTGGLSGKYSLDSDFITGSLKATGGESTINTMVKSDDKQVTYDVTSNQDLEVSALAVDRITTGTIAMNGYDLVGEEEMQSLATTGDAMEGQALTKGGYKIIYRVNDRNIAYGGENDPNSDCTWWWWNPGIDFGINLENVYYSGGVVTQSEFLNSNVASMNTWNAETNKYGIKSFKNIYGTTKNYDDGINDGTNTISWTSSLPDGVVANTAARYDPTTRRLLETDIGYNRNEAAILDSANVRSLVSLHELGHVNGLYDLDVDFKDGAEDGRAYSIMHFNIDEIKCNPYVLDSLTKELIKYKLTW
jgi:hypothetical protein